MTHNINRHYFIPIMHKFLFYLCRIQWYRARWWHQISGLVYLTREIGHQQLKITALSATLEKFLRFLASKIEFLLWAAHAWSQSLFASFQFSNSYRGWHNPFLSWVRSWDHGIRRFFGPCAYQISVRLASRQRCFLGKANRTWLRQMVQLREEICTQTLKQAKPRQGAFSKVKDGTDLGKNTRLFLSVSFMNNSMS